MSNANLTAFLAPLALGDFALKGFAPPIRGLVLSQRLCHHASRVTRRKLAGEFWFWLIFIMAILDRVFRLARFGVRFTDSDQVILWMGAQDFARGIFHEPCVYGQNYGFMLEPLL